MLYTIYRENLKNGYGLPNTAIPVVKAVRIVRQDGRVILRLCVEKDGHPIPVFEGPLSLFDAKPPQLGDYGQIVSIDDTYKLQKALDKQYAQIPEIPEVSGLGWQANAHGRYKDAFAGGLILLADGSVQVGCYKGGLPGLRARSKAGFFNEYMLGHSKPTRQIALLHGLAAPLTGLLGDGCYLLSLCGKSSTGKTTLAKLAQSQTCHPGYPVLCKSFHATSSALEQSLDGNFGLSVLVDDTSLAPDRFDWAGLIYRLYSGTGKERLDRNGTLRPVARFCTTITFTSETPILDRIDPSKEGALGRLIEIPVQGDDLFDNARHCHEVEEYLGDHYGFTVLRLVRAIFKEGPSKIKKEVTDEIVALETRFSNEETVVKRHFKHLAVLRVTARLADQYLGYRFESDRITDFLIDTIRSALIKVRRTQLPSLARDEIYPLLCELPSQDVTCGGRHYDLIRHQDLKRVVNDVKENVMGHFTYMDVKKSLDEQGLIVSQSGTFSCVHSVDGKSARGILLNKGAV